MALFDKLSGAAVDGFTTVILLILIIGSVLMFSVGLIGIYVGRIYEEVKRRPGYLIDQGSSTLDAVVTATGRTVKRAPKPSAKPAAKSTSKRATQSAATKPRKPKADKT